MPRRVAATATHASVHLSRSQNVIQVIAKQRQRVLGEGAHHNSSSFNRAWCHVLSFSLSRCFSLPLSLFFFLRISCLSLYCKTACRGCCVTSLRAHTAQHQLLPVLLCVVFSLVSFFLGRSLSLCFALGLRLVIAVYLLSLSFFRYLTVFSHFSPALTVFHSPSHALSLSSSFFPHALFTLSPFSRRLLGFSLSLRPNHNPNPTGVHRQRRPALTGARRSRQQAGGLPY